MEDSQQIGGATVTPENGKVWAKLTQTKIQKGRFQGSDLLTRLQRMEVEEAAQKGAALEQAKREVERIMQAARVRIKKHEVIVKDSQSCILAIEEAASRLQDVLSRTRHERYTRFADSQVNERRAELREKRPLAEAWKDPLQVNLAKEKIVLATARKELLEREKEVSLFIEQLMKVRQALSYDTGVRRLKVEHETQLLKPQIEAPPAAKKKEEGAAATSMEDTGATAAPPTPAAAAAPADGEPTAEPASPASPKTGGHQELPDLALDGPEARQHILKTQALLLKVENFIEKSLDAIRRSRTEGSEATKAVEKTLAKRTIELASIKRDLEQNILTVRYNIEVGKKGIEKFNKRLDPKDTEKAAKINEAQKVLDNLLKSEAALIEEVRTKTGALNLDNICRRITATVAAEKRPGTGKDKTMKPSASSPNLGGTEVPAEIGGERTMSPAGGSSALKAGAALAVSAG